MIKQTVLYTLYFCAIVGLITAIVLNFSNTSDKPAKQGPRPQTITSTPASPSKPATTSQRQKTTVSSGHASSTSTNVSNQPSQQLADTGPASVTVVFVGSTAAGVLAYQIRMRRMAAVR